jgi:hypothetical protein
MSYKPPQKATEVSLLKLGASGIIAAGDYLDLTSDVAGITGQTLSGGNTLNLPAGHYLIEVSCGLDRTVYSDFLTYRCEVNGVLEGTLGAMDSTDSGNYSFTVDQAGCATSQDDSWSLKIKVVSCTANAWTAQDAYSYLIITRVY